MYEATRDTYQSRFSGFETLPSENLGGRSLESLETPSETDHMNNQCGK